MTLVKGTLRALIYVNRHLRSSIAAWSLRCSGTGKVREGSDVKSKSRRRKEKQQHITWFPLYIGAKYSVLCRSITYARVR